MKIIFIWFVVQSILFANEPIDFLKIDNWLKKCNELKKSNFIEAKPYLDSILLYSQKLNYRSAYYKGLDYLIELSITMNDLTKLDSLLEIYKIESNKEYEKSYINKYHYHAGNSFLVRDQIEMALAHFESCYPYYKESSDQSELKSILISFAIIYNKLGLSEKVIEYSNESFKLAIQAKDSFEIISILTNLIGAYENLKMQDSINYYYEQMIHYASVYKNDFMRSVCFLNYGVFLENKKSLDSAAIYLNQSIQYFRVNQLTSYELISLISLAKVEYARKHIQKFKELLNTASKLKEIPGSNLQLEIEASYYSMLSDLAIYQGNFKEANHHLIKSNTLNDSLRNISNRELSLTSDIKLKKMNFEISKLQSDIKSAKQQRFIIILSSILALFVAIWIFYFLLNKKESRLQKERITSLEKEQEFVKIESKLNGQIQERTRISKEIHDDLGASLTSISLLTEVLKKKFDLSNNIELSKISNTSKEMVDKLNEIIWSLNTKNDSVKSLVGYSVKFAHNILELSNIKLNYHEDEDLKDHLLDSMSRRNIYLCIKEAFHNIVKHSNAKEVNLHITSNGVLQIKIQDDGQGFDEFSIPKFRNGLDNMKIRIEEIGGEFEISSKQGTHINIIYPYSHE